MPYEYKTKEKARITTSPYFKPNSDSRTQIRLLNNLGLLLPKPLAMENGNSILITNDQEPEKKRPCNEKRECAIRTVSTIERRSHYHIFVQKLYPLGMEFHWICFVPVDCVPEDIKSILKSWVWTVFIDERKGEKRTAKQEEDKKKIEKFCNDIKKYSISAGNSISGVEIEKTVSILTQH